MKKLLTFTATWCGPCKMLKPILQQLHDEGLIVWENHDIDQEAKFAQNFLVSSVPTLLFYEADGNVSKKEVGFMPREKILKLYHPDKDFTSVQSIIESTEVSIVEDAVLEVEPVVEAVLEAEAAVEVELVADEPIIPVLEETVVEDEPIVKEEAPVVVHHEPVTIIDLIDDTVVFDGAVFEDEFSSEDLGNDTPEDVVDPEDLF
jgi:thioredoxin 1